MNVIIGASNGSITNNVIDDPLVNEIHIALIISGKYIHWFALKNNSTDYPVMCDYHYNFSNMYYPKGRIETCIGYQTYQMKRSDNIVTFEFSFYDRDSLDKFIGSTNIESDTHARRIAMRYFIDCDIQDVAFDKKNKRWQASLYTIGELVSNDHIITNQIITHGQLISNLRNDTDVITGIISTIQKTLNALNRAVGSNREAITNIQTVVNGINSSLQDAQAQIVRLDIGVGALIETEKSVIRDDTNLKEAVEKIQEFLKNIQIATSNKEQFITYQPTKITLPNKDLLFEIQYVQQKLESIKELIYKMNNDYVTKIVNHTKSNTFLF